uniref:Golgin A7 family member B n=1 Tax=Terrapene triunguis TaxID=2587831 RepID=A0A674IL50_9SAUR
MSPQAHDLQELRRSASLATKVFVQRDYSDGTLCQFQTKFPLELDSRLERQLFEETVKTLNGFYAEAEKIGGSSYLEGCLACATAYFIFLCMETHYEKVGPGRARPGWTSSWVGVLKASPLPLSVPPSELGPGAGCVSGGGADRGKGATGVGRRDPRHGAGSRDPGRGAGTPGWGLGTRSPHAGPGVGPCVKPGAAAQCSL